MLAREGLSSRSCDTSAPSTPPTQQQREAGLRALCRTGSQRVGSAVRTGRYTSPFGTRQSHGSATTARAPLTLASSSVIKLKVVVARVVVCDRCVRATSDQHPPDAIFFAFLPSLQLYLSGRTQCVYVAVFDARWRTGDAPETHVPLRHVSASDPWSADPYWSTSDCARLPMIRRQASRQTPLLALRSTYTAPTSPAPVPPWQCA